MSQRKRKRRKRRPAGTGPQPNPRAGAVGPGPAATPDAPPAPDAADPPARSATARRQPQGPPPPPWGSFPLSEIVVLIALVLLIGGFFVAPPRGAVMLGAGLVLGSLAGLELSAREHFSGYRSHTLLLGGAVGVATVAGLYALAGLSPAICAAVGAVAFGAAAYLFGRAFRRRSGGSMYRVRP